MIPLGELECVTYSNIYYLLLSSVSSSSKNELPIKVISIFLSEETTFSSRNAHLNLLRTYTFSGDKTHCR